MFRGLCFNLKVCLILFVLISLYISGLELSAKEQRIAVIPADKESSKLSDLLLIKLTQKNIDVLERERINAVLKEQKLNVNFSYKNAIKIGQLLSANFFVVVTNKKSVIYETRFGIRLVDYLYEGNDLDEISSKIATKILQAFSKFDNLIAGEQKIIAFAPSRSVAFSGKKSDDFQKFLSLLKRAMINQKKVIVLERTHLSSLLKEKSLINKGAGKNLLNSSLLLDIEATQTNHQSGIEVNIWLQTLQDKVIYNIKRYIANDSKLVNKTQDISDLIALKIYSLSDKYFSKEEKIKEAAYYYALWKSYISIRKYELALLAIQNAYALDKKYFDKRVITEFTAASVRFSNSKKTLQDKKDYVNKISEFASDLKKFNPKSQKKTLQYNVYRLNAIQTNDKELKKLIRSINSQFTERILELGKKTKIPDKIVNKHDCLVVLEKMKQIRKLISGDYFNISNADLWIKYMLPLWEKILTAPNLLTGERAGSLDTINLDLFITHYLVKSFWYLKTDNASQNKALYEFKMKFVNSPTPVLAAWALKEATYVDSGSYGKNLLDDKQILRIFDRLINFKCNNKKYQKKVQKYLKDVLLNYSESPELYNTIRDKYGIILGSVRCNADYYAWAKKSRKLLASRKAIQKGKKKTAKKIENLFENQDSESPYSFVKLFKNKIPFICMGKPLYKNKSFYIIYYRSDYYLYSTKKMLYNVVRLFRIDLNGDIAEGKLAECPKGIIPKEKYPRAISSSHYIQATKNGLILLPLDLSKPYAVNIPEIKNRVATKMVVHKNSIYLWFETTPYRLVKYDLASNKYIILYGQEQRLNNPFRERRISTGKTPLLVDDSGNYILFMTGASINWMYNVQDRTWHKPNKLKIKLSFSDKSDRHTCYRNCAFEFNNKKQKFLQTGYIHKYNDNSNYWYDVKGIKSYKHWINSCNEMKQMKYYNLLSPGSYLSRNRIINNCLVFLPNSYKAFPLIGKYPHKQKIKKKKYPTQKIENISSVSDCGNYIMGKYRFRYSLQYYLAKVKSNKELEKLSIYIDTKKK